MKGAKPLLRSDNLMKSSVSVSLYAIG
jgi:hypothetical protein